MTRKFATALAAATMISSAAAFADPAAIGQSITDIAAGTNRHDWARVRAAFADTVNTDYSSLWGGEPVTQPADDLVAGWAAFLPGFDITHHMVTNLTITDLTATTARAEVDFTATHRIDEDLWVLGGRYSYELVKSEARWQVCSMTMTTQFFTAGRRCSTILVRPRGFGVMSMSISLSRAS